MTLCRVVVIVIAVVVLLAAGCRVDVPLDQGPDGAIARPGDGGLGPDTGAVGGDGSPRGDAESRGDGGAPSDGGAGTDAGRTSADAGDAGAPPDV